MHRQLFFVLDDHGEPAPVEIGDPRFGQRWAALARGDPDPNRVERTTVGEWEISTVFLGIDHGFGVGKPVLWETMIFGPEPLTDWCERYTSKADALAGHARAVEMVKDKTRSVPRSRQRSAHTDPSRRHHVRG